MWVNNNDVLHNLKSRQPPHSIPDEAAQSLVQLDPECVSKDGASPTSLGNLCRCPTALK